MFTSFSIARSQFWTVACLSIATLLGSLHADNGLPDSTSAYMNKRNAWVLEDVKINFSSGMSLNTDEQKLDKIIREMVGNFRNKYITSNLFCPAKNFLGVKECLEGSPLFQLLKRMPKGGVLHIHTSSTGSATYLVERAIANGAYINMKEDSPVIQGVMNFYSKDNAPEGYEPMEKLAKEDPQFIPKVVRMISMTEADSLAPDPWEKFNACFIRTRGLFHNTTIFKEYYQNAFEVLAADNLDFVELRAGVKELRGGLNDIANSQGTVVNRQEVIKLFQKIVENVNVKYPHFKLKIIIANARSKDLAQERVLLEEAFQLRATNPGIVVGYDLVGDETTGHSTLYYLDNLLVAAKEFSNKYKVNLPYFFHDGESDWESDSNLYDAILLQTRRIGHGFNLFYFPWLLQQVKKQQICVEICPISNQILGYVSDLRIHPAASYLRQGVPCVISSDDPMVFSTSGLSYDFWEAIMAWNLNLADIKQLCLNSIQYSTLEPQEKQEMMNIWQKKWDVFVQETLKESSKKS